MNESLYEVDHVQFGLLGPEEIKSLAQVEITHSSMYHASLPKDNGMNDVRLGTTDKRYRCFTCRHTLTECPGHTGFIQLHAPVLHIGYIDVVCKVLRCICYWCSALKVDPLDPQFEQAKYRQKRKKSRLTNLSALCKHKKRCLKCEAVQPQIARVGTTIKAEFKCSREEFASDAMYDAAQVPLSITRIGQMLKHIQDQDLAFLGFDPQISRPEWMVLHTLLVPPPAIRPSVIISEGSRSRGQDDITVKLQEIQKVNGTIAKYVSEGKAIDKLQEDLQSHIAQLIDKDPGNHLKKKKAGGRTSEIRSIKQRITGKNGRLRKNLMGKRVDFSARSVITPDSAIDLQELGVPEYVALHHTFPERVTSFNLEQLKARVVAGAGVLHGASAVISSDSTMVKLTMIGKDKRRKLANCLRPGSIVERYLQNGDPVCFNRQPSLHKESMMGHRVKIMKGLTFRLNVLCTSPYNADFDGDEMNMHTPQSYKARAELEHIMNVQHQLVSPQANKPIIGCIQDTCIGAFRMSSQNTFITPEKFMNYSLEVTYTDYKHMPIPAIVWPRPLYTGKQMLSYCLPKVFMTKKVRGLDTLDRMDDRCVVVENGILHCGQLCKKSIGSTAGGIPHICCNDLSNQRAIQFLSDIQRLVRVWLRETGFSIGLGDCITSLATQEKVEALIDNTFNQTLHPDMSESEQFGALQKVLNQAGKVVVDHLHHTNAFLQCSHSGSKGSLINIAQIMGCIGQSAVCGARPQHLLQCYAPNETHPASRGFCANSYVLGLSPQDFFYAACAGREGMINTAVKTAMTGYISRKLIKAMESLTIVYDRTVRSSTNHILQFSYGGDHFDATHIETVRVPQLEWADARIDTRLLPWRNRVRDIKLQTENSFTASLHLPVNVPRLLQQMYVQDFAESSHVVDQDAQINTLLTYIERICGTEESLHVRLHIALELMYRTESFTQAQLSWLLHEIKRKVVRSLVEYGTGVGPIAASSIGEPTTVRSYLHVLSCSLFELTQHTILANDTQQ